MGTRGSAGFIYKDKESLSYNHFDSYPDGLGKEVLRFISKVNKEDGWNKFKENASYLKNITGKITDNDMIEKYKKYSDLSVSEKSYTDPYCLFRKIQGSEWMNEVYKGYLQDYMLNNKFIKDSLFCEYAYIINLDNMKLEFYDGYQKKPQLGNRFGVEYDDEYYPCRLVSIFDLESINDDTVDNIIEKMNNICDTGIDDPSIVFFLRKNKLEELNEKRES